MAKSKRRGIYCIETVWFGTKDQTSVRPMLQLLESSFLQVPFIHRTAQTKREFQLNLRKWLELRPSEFPILYLGYHGRPGKVEFEDENGSEMTFNSVGERLSKLGRCNYRLIHFASCSTLNLSDNAAEQFLNKTDASAVSGYMKDVDWMESMALDLLLLESLQFGGNKQITSDVVKSCRDGLTKNPAYLAFSKSLGFTLAIR